MNLIELELKNLFISLSVIIPFLFIYLLSYLIISKYRRFTNKVLSYYVGNTIVIFISFVFPFLYFDIKIGIILFLILLSIFSLKNFDLENIKKLKNKLLSQNKFEYLNRIILISSILFVMYWDALNHISTNFPDTAYNWIWIKSNYFYTGQVFYFPGLSIFSFIPVTLFWPEFGLNFLAASLAVIVIIGINLILRMLLSTKSLIIFNLILISPIYYPLLYTRISLNNSALFPLFYFSIIVFILDRFKKKPEINIFFLFIITLGAVVTAPHILFLVTPGIVVALLTISCVNKASNFSFIIVGLFVSTSIIFSSIFSSSSHILESINKNTRKYSYIEKAMNLIIEFARLKPPIRAPFESIQSSLTYLIIFIALITLVVSMKLKLINLIFISVLTLVFGISIQTGIGEFSMLKGRIGWYFMYTVALFVALIFDSIKSKIKILNNYYNINSFILFIVVVNFIMILLHPPKAYRSIDERVLIEFKKIVSSDFRTRLKVMSDIEEIQLISPKIIFTFKEYDNLKNFDYIVLNMNKNIPDATLANLRNYEDQNFERFNQIQNNLIIKRLKMNNMLKDESINSGFKILVERSDWLILKKSLLNQN